MGMLIEGRWSDSSDDPRLRSGRFVRQDTTFRRRVEPDDEAEFPAVAGRYHLFASWSCPWSHRAMLARSLKGLGGIVPLIIASGPRIEGYSAGDGSPRTLPGTDLTIRFLHEVYATAQRDYTGRVTIPVLWDSEKATIVNNESSDLLAIFNEGFAGLSSGPDLYPSFMREEIDAVNARVYHCLSNAVYEAGYTNRQNIYEDAVERVFQTLDWLEDRLTRSEFAVGNQLTEADIRLFPTLFRFSPIYAVLFKCNLRPLCAYPRIVAYMRRLAAIEGVAQTLNLQAAKEGYYLDRRLNPTGIVPKGPLRLEWQ